VALSIFVGGLGKMQMRDLALIREDISEAENDLYLAQQDVRHVQSRLERANRRMDYVLQELYREMGEIEYRSWAGQLEAESWKHV
jgi:hypothetical protein